jgi:hypothetical protein
MHQVRSFPEQSFPLVQRFPYQAQFAVLQVAQSAVNDARGSAGHATSEIVLFHQQGALSRPGTLPRHGHSVDSTSDYYDVETLAVQSCPLLLR